MPTVPSSCDWECAATTLAVVGMRDPDWSPIGDVGADTVPWNMGDEARSGAGGTSPPPLMPFTTTGFGAGPGSGFGSG